MSILYTHIFPIFYIPQNILWKICGCITIVVVILLPCALYLDVDVAIKIRRNPTPERGLKTILYWTKMFGDKHFYFGDDHVFKGCPVSSCFATDDRNFINIEDFDALLFHGIQLNVTDVPVTRSPGQRFIFVDMESPANWRLDDTMVPDGFYNWTMTYRIDSDVPRPYGTIVDKVSKKVVYPLGLATTEFYGADDFPANSTKFQGKKRMAAWFVSHCRTVSQRERYVVELQKYIDVDIFGHCGPRKCEPRQDCYEMLESHYYFYLSFENSLCQDYVTEKLYKAMRYNVVPIVYGGANYSNFAPTHSYINVADFETPEHLAKYLKYLRNNTEEYEKYFWWKRRYEVAKRSHKVALCRMCEMLHREDHTRKGLVGLKDWWTNGICRSPVEILRKIM